MGLVTLCNHLSGEKIVHSVSIVEFRHMKYFLMLKAKSFAFPVDKGLTKPAQVLDTRLLAMECGSVLTEGTRAHLSLENTAPSNEAFLSGYRMHLFSSSFEDFPASSEDQCHSDLIYIVIIGLCPRSMIAKEYRWLSHDRSLNIFPNIHKFHMACLWREHFPCKSQQV